MKDILEHPDEDDDADVDETDDASSAAGTAFSSPTPTKLSFNSHSILFGSGAPSARARPSPPSATKAWLISVYKDRVDPLFKPLHWPSTLSILQRGGKKSAEERALEYGIYFVAACSLFDHELERRQSIVEQFRQTVEEALTEAGLLTSTSLILLQAFVIHLVRLKVRAVY